MAIIITGIKPKQNPWPDDKVQAHLSIDNFQWQDNVTQKTGLTGRVAMFDWIVNRGGRPYVKKVGTEKFIPVLGVTGGYIRATDDGKWTDDLLELPLIT